MTTTKQRKIRVLLDELIHNLDSAFYWANEYDLNKPCDDKDNLDALYVLQRYVENIERIIDSVRCLIICTVTRSDSCENTSRDLRSVTRSRPANSRNTSIRIYVVLVRRPVRLRMSSDIKTLRGSLRVCGAR